LAHFGQQALTDNGTRWIVSSGLHTRQQGVLWFNVTITLATAVKPGSWHCIVAEIPGAARDKKQVSYYVNKLTTIDVLVVLGSGAL
jgi:hypothetical protein